MNYKTKKGFTLIELMVAMGVIAVLATLSVVAIQQVQTTLRDTQRRDAAGAFNLAVAAQASRNGNQPPDDSGSEQVVIDTTNFAICVNQDAAQNACGASDDILVETSDLGGLLQPATVTGVDGTQYCYGSNASEYVVGVQLEDLSWFYIGAEDLQNTTDCT